MIKKMTMGKGAAIGFFGGGWAGSAVGGTLGGMGGGLYGAFEGGDMTLEDRASNILHRGVQGFTAGALGGMALGNVGGGIGGALGGGLAGAGARMSGATDKSLKGLLRAARGEVKKSGEKGFMDIFKEQLANKMPGKPGETLKQKLSGQLSQMKTSFKKDPKAFMKKAGKYAAIGIGVDLAVINSGPIFSSIGQSVNERTEARRNKVVENASMTTDYTEQAPMIEELAAGSAIRPDLTLGGWSQSANNDFKNSTQGLVFGLHNRRHG